jgi:iron complex transport system substrate-binding protein
MTRGDLAAGVWALLLLAATAGVAGLFAARSAGAASQPTAADDNQLHDATGRAIPLRRYARIASASSLADGLLFELCEPDRIVALSAAGARSDPEHQHYAGRASLAGAFDIEALLQLRIDLLIVTQHAAESDLARLREAGVQVYDLGSARGMNTLRPNLIALATLLGERARGERLWQRLVQRMQSVAADIPEAQRKAALYVASYAGKLYGGTRGTSYHDVLQAAGLRDLAAEHYVDWPQYDPEQLLALDPALIVTNTSSRMAFCGDPWLGKLRACVDASAIIEMPAALIGDPGLRMLDAAETLRTRVYGPPPPLIW